MRTQLLRKVVTFILIMIFGFVTFPAECLSIRAKAASALSAPLNISYSQTNKGIVVKWDKINGADAYRVYIKKENGQDLNNKEGWKKYKTVKSNNCLIKMEQKEDGKFVGINITSLKKEGNSYIEGEKGEPIAIRWRAKKEYPGFIGPEKYGFELVRTGDKRKKSSGDVLVWKSNEKTKYYSTASIYTKGTTNDIKEWIKALTKLGFYLEEKSQNSNQDLYKESSKTKLDYYLCYDEEKIGILTLEENIGHIDSIHNYTDDYVITYTIKLNLYDGFDIKGLKKEQDHT